MVVDADSMMSTGLSGRRPAQLVATALAVVTVGLLLFCVIPGTRVPALLAISGVATVAPLVGMALHRPADRLPWVVFTGVVSCCAVSVATATAFPVVGQRAQELGTVGGTVLAAYLFTQHVRARAVSRERLGRAGWARRADQAIVTVLIGLAVAQVMVTARTVEAPDDAVWVPVDVLLIALAVRFVLSRAELTVSIEFLVGGAVLLGVCDVIASSSGQRLRAPDDVSGMLWASAMALYVVAALHPSMRLAFVSASRRRLRPESQRVTGLIALAPVPVCLFVLNPAGRLPSTVYVSVGAVVAALVIARGAGALRVSEGHAQRDPLTGLMNRRGLRAAFDDLLLLGAAAPGTVGRLALVDLDDFKIVNDTHGAEIGDKVLCAVADRLTAAVGSSGSAARSGGDEFVLLLRPGAPTVADVVADALADPVRVGDAEQRYVEVGCSAGWVELCNTSNLSTALGDANVALCAAKSSVSGAVTRYSPEQRSAMLDELSLAADLRRLFSDAGGAGTLVVLFQPLVGFSGRRVHGYEALVRWDHPTRGSVPPDVFLPIAESRGLGAGIDAWVLREACRAASDWAARGLDRTVSVNLGRSSMMDPDLADRVTEVLADTGLPADRLHLEITEHDQVPVDAGVVTLRALAVSGTVISLDDFGTGYTSLNYLQRYPVSVLKLDRSITGADASSELITGIVGFADALGISVLAEGIETEEQLERLASLGIDSGQGWLFGRPVPAEQLDHTPTPGEDLSSVDGSPGRPRRTRAMAPG